MNVSAPFIVRPIATTLLMIGVTLLGLVAYFILPIAGVPQVDARKAEIERLRAENESVKTKKSASAFLCYKLVFYGIVGALLFLSETTQNGNWSLILWALII
jgi:hypothetical protein